MREFNPEWEDIIKYSDTPEEKDWAKKTQVMESLFKTGMKAALYQLLDIIGTGKEEYTLEAAATNLYAQLGIEEDDFETDNARHGLILFLVELFPESLYYDWAKDRVIRKYEPRNVNEIRPLSIKIPVQGETK